MSGDANGFDLAALLRRAIEYAHALRAFHEQHGAHGHLSIEDFRLTDGRIADLFTLSKTDLFSKELLKYASPEQAGRLSSLDTRSDIYSLGIIYYELFTGTVPFDSDDLLKLVHSHMAVKPTPPHVVEPRLPKIVSDIVMKQLEKSPESRYASCDGVLDNLHTCLSTYTSQGDIPPFEIGHIDRDSQFQIPDQLYGRQHEIAVLDTTFNRAMRGEIVLCLVAGYSGIGKSSLVRRMRDHITASGGLLVEGKFDQYHRETPYSALFEAFGGLVSQILGGSVENITSWRERIDAALGENASVVMDAFPQIEILIGPKPRAPTLSDAAARDRFNHVFTELLKVFASQDSPLVMFLDDLQWIDFASMALIRHVATRARHAHLLFVGAYRDNEVDTAHPLTTLLEELRLDDAPIYELSLGPLSQADLAEMIRETCVRLNAPEALAQLVMQKTGGNPFFSRQFLKTMYLEQLLYFDFEDKAWRWKPSTRLEDSTSNVVELIMGRLARQPVESRVALKIAACIGKRFDLPLLATVMAVEPSSVLTLLAGSLQDDLLTPLSADSSAPFTFSFAHDRVQQAAYQQPVGPPQAEVHLAIGRALWSGNLDTLPQQSVFAIADQINLALDLLTDATERRDVAILNLMAAQRARDSLAYAAAARYLEAGRQCLPAVARWTEPYDVTYRLYLASAEIYSLLNADEQFQTMMTELLEQVTLREDRLDVRICQTAHYCLSGRMAQGLEVGCLGLAEIGVVIPPLTDQSALGQAFEHELAQFRKETQGRELEQFLFELPRVNDRLTESLLRLIGSMGDAATNLNPPLHSLLAVLGARRSITYGNTPLSPLMYTLLGQGMIANERAYREGSTLAHIALRLMEEKSLDLWSYGRARTHALATILHWTENRLNLLDPIEEALLVTRRAHDPLYTGYLLDLIVFIRFFAGHSMDEVLTAYERVLEHCRPSETMNVIIAFTQCYAGAASALRAETDSLTSITGTYVDEGEFRTRYADMPTLIGFFTGAKIPLYGLAAKWRDVLDLADDPSLARCAMFPPYASSIFWSGLAAVKLLATTPDQAEAAALTARFEAALQFLCQIRDTACPDNVAHQIEFLLAERACREGRPQDADTHFRSAITAAKTHSYRLDQAYFEETYGLWLATEGQQPEAGRDLLHTAQRRYVQAQAYRLAERVSQALATTDKGGLPVDVSWLDRVDTLAILQAVQALNRQLELQPLLEHLLTIILEFSGAERGCIVAIAGDALQLEWSVGDAADDGLPQTLVRYVAKSHEVMILDNPARIIEARAASAFSQDPYFQAARPLSVLCQPIDRHTPVRRVLYLEHRRMAHTFTAKKQQVLSLLCLQAAILIENAEQYSRLEAMVSERTQALEQANAELRQHQLELVRARDAAQEAARAKAQFLANMSHEIRTPLNTVMGMTTLTRRLDLPSAAKHYLEKAQLSAEHLLSIINDVLDFSRIDSGRLTLENVSFSLEATFRELTTLVGYKAFDKGLLLVYDIDPAVPDTVIGDPLRLKQVLVNLIGNAVKFTERGHIHVRVRCVPGADSPAVLKFEVTDTGMGIASQDQSRLFQEFSQVDASEMRKYGGTGLGLAICKSLVEAMGGSIGVVSAPDSGSTFHCSIPFTVEPAAADAAPRPSHLAGKRALFADSHDFSRAHNSALLESLGLRVEGAGDHADANAAIRKAAAANAPFDFIFVAPEFPGTQSLRKAYGKAGTGPRFLTLRYPGSDDAAVDGDPADGADARFTLPLLRGVFHEALEEAFFRTPAQDIDKDTPPAASRGQFGHNRFLVVDDHDTNRFMLVELLRLTGVQSIEAENGFEALEILRHDAQFDCVLMDKHMPVIDGLTAARTIREEQAWDSIAIIMLTGDVFFANDPPSDSPVDAYLVKPINPDKLLSAVTAALQRRQATCGG